MPLSSSTGTRPSTASTTPGRASSVAIAPSTCRPPWLETTIPSIPASTARRASSGCRMPLSTIGSRVRSRRNGQVVPGQGRPRVDADEALHRGASATRAQGAIEALGVGARERQQRAQRRQGWARLRRVVRIGVGGGHQAPEHRVAGVLGDPLAAQEGQVGEVEVARAPAQDGGVQRHHDRAARRTPRLAPRSSPPARSSCSSRAGTSAGCRPAPARTAPSGARPGWRRSSARPRARAACATARSASRWASSSTPIGASSIGAGSRAPSSSIEVSRCETSRSIRGTMRQRSNAARLAATRRLGTGARGDVGESLLGHRLAGRGLERAKSTGTRGSRPLTPSR